MYSKTSFTHQLFCGCEVGNALLSKRGASQYTKVKMNIHREVKSGQNNWKMRHTVFLLQSVIVPTQYCLLMWMQSAYSLDLALCLSQGNTSFPFHFSLLQPHDKVDVPDTFTIYMVKSLRFLWWELCNLLHIRDVSDFPLFFYHDGV